MSLLLSSWASRSRWTKWDIPCGCHRASLSRPRCSLRDANPGVGGHTGRGRLSAQNTKHRQVGLPQNLTQTAGSAPTRSFQLQNFSQAAVRVYNKQWTLKHAAGGRTASAFHDLTSFCWNRKRWAIMFLIVHLFGWLLAKYLIDHFFFVNKTIYNWSSYGCHSQSKSTKTRVILQNVMW